MEEKNEAQNIPLLCRKKCGFYGSPNFDGLCSKCHRSAQAQAENAQSVCNVSSLGDKLGISDCLQDEARDVLKESERQTSDAVTDSSQPSNPEQRVPSINGSVTASSNMSPSVDPKTSAEPNRQLLEDGKYDDNAGSPASCSSSEASTKKRPRCGVCNKRVGLTGFSCRCGGLFCSLHRYSDTHECPYDYRETGQEEIRRLNPQVLCQKINKI